MRWTRIVAALALLLVVALAVVLIVLNSIDWSRYQEPVVEAVREATGRELAVDGELRLHIGLRPGVAVEGVRFQNAAWGTKPDMVSVGRFEVQLALWPLLFGRVEVGRIVLSDVDVLIETDETGRANTEFEPATSEASTEAAEAPQTADTVEVPPEPAADAAPPAQSPAGTAPADGESDPSEILALIRELVIENATLIQRDGVTGDQLEFEIERLTARMKDVDAPLELSLDARYNGEPIGVRASVGGAGQLMADGAIDLDLVVEAGEARIEVAGPIRRPMEGRDFSLQLQVAGDRLDGFSGLAGSDLPAIGPYSLAALLSDGEKLYRIDDLDLKVGESVLRGDIVVNLGGERPRVDASLESTLLRAEDFSSSDTGAPSGGMDPDQRGGGDASTHSETESEREIAQEAASPPARPAGADTAEPSTGPERLFSDDPLPLDGLAAADAKIDLRIAHLISGTLELRAVQLNLKLEDRLLEIEPLRAELLGGAVDATLDLDARKASPVVALHADLDQIDSGKALKAFEVTDALTGAKIDVVTELRGSGASVRRIMASLAGDLSIEVGTGEIRRDWAEAQLGQWAPLVIGKKKSKEKPSLNCAVTRFEVDGGVARSRGIAVDLPLLALLGKGKVDLRDETLDLALEPVVKEAEADLVTPPGRVKGTLAAPKFGVDQNALASKAVDIAARLIGGDSVAGGKNLRTSPGIAGCEELIEKERELMKSGSSKSSKKKAKKSLKKAKKKLGKKGTKEIEDALGNLLGR